VACIICTAFCVTYKGDLLLNDLTLFILTLFFILLSIFNGTVSLYMAGVRIIEDIYYLNMHVAIAMP
jgi:hypothetical protein